ncbi:gra-orf6 [Symbiodinium sp. CCMP2456]|nr:gra-orf6 [Symbiodinium sp. CCMP2456]
MWARFHRRAFASLLKLQPPPHRQGLLPLLALGAGTGVLVLKRPASSPCAAEQQKVALITGSSTGIGKAVAQRLAAEGYRVVVNSHSTVEEGTALAATLPGGMYIQADCSKREGCEGLVEEVLKRCGRLDLLICNAGLGKVIPHGNLELIDDEQLLSRKVTWVLVTALTVCLCYALARPAICSDVDKCQLHHDSAADLIPYSRYIASALSAVLLHELVSVILTHRTAKKAIHLIPNIRESLLPSALLCTTFAVLLAENAVFLIGDTAWFAHAASVGDADLDGLPVYSVFYAEWLINVPILLILAGTCALSRPAPEVSEPLVITNVYMILAWSANFISSTPVRYCVVCASFLMYFRASRDMILWVLRWKKDNPEGHVLGRPLLAISLIVVFGVYGIVYLGRLHGIVPWSGERMFFLVMNFTTKLFASMALAGIRSSEFQEVLLGMLANTQTSFKRALNYEDAFVPWWRQAGRQAACWPSILLGPASSEDGRLQAFQQAADANSLQLQVEVHRFLLLPREGCRMSQGRGSQG